MSGPDVVRGN